MDSLAPDVAHSSHVLACKIIMEVMEVAGIRVWRLLLSSLRRKRAMRNENDITCRNLNQKA